MFEEPTPLAGALRAGGAVSPGRRPDELDGRVGGRLPGLRREASGAHFTDVDGNEYVDLCLGDTGAMTGHAPEADRRGRRRADRARDTSCCPPRTRSGSARAGRRFGLPYWQFALTATDANRYTIRSPGRSPAAPRWSCTTGATTARSTRRSRSSTDGGIASRPQQHRRPGRHAADDPRRRDQRPRRRSSASWRTATSPLPLRAGADEHRHRAARPRLPRGRPRADPPPRRACS